MTAEHRPEKGADAVTDPGWEAELRAGLEADGGGGSVEPELAIAKLLLHARAPSELAMAREDLVWSEIDHALAPTPWWRRRVVLWGGPMMAAAAAVALVLVMRDDPHRPHTGGSADLLEQQFAVLAPAARAEVAKNVDDQRGRLRGDLIAMARASAGTQGGAP
jgi:hypothetical protein